MGQRPCNQKIIGFTTFGMAVPALRGKEDPPPAGQNQQGHQQYQQQQQYTPPPNPNNQQQQPDPNVPDPNATVSRQEYDDLMRRMQAADRNKSQTEAKLKEFEDKDKSELERAQRDAQEAIARAEKAEKELQESHIEREFLKLPDMQWHDPGDALRLLDREGIEVGEDGTVKGVKEAAQKLAKSKQFLVKAPADPSVKNEDKGGQQNNGGEGGSGGSATGNNPAPPNEANNRNSDRDRLTKKFPALGRR